MRKIPFFICLLFTLNNVNGQTDYSDVAVIVNDNSTVSQQIGAYFKAARNIPDQNIIHVSCTTSEIADDAMFEQLRQQVETYLVNNSLDNSINYLVTTKGIPLSVYRTYPGTPGTTAASVDSELSLILGPHANEIGLSSHAPNPYFNTQTHFSRATHGIYLVTRLDGYTLEDVQATIDNSGPGILKDPATVTNILDLTWAASAQSFLFFDAIFDQAYNELTTAGWAGVYDSTSTQLRDQQNVLIYCGVKQTTYDDTLHNTWTSGSIASLGTEATSWSFDPGNPGNNTLTTADLIAEGCTGTHGYVSIYNYASLVIKEDILIQYYLNEQEEYNLAESFYSAINSLSWLNVITGDPKATVSIDPSAAVPETQNVIVELFPNPCSDELLLKSKLKMDNWIITDLNGQTIIESTDDPGSFVSINISDLNEGFYFIQLELDGKTLIKKFLKHTF